MRVKENGSDRTAEAHIHVDGRVDALEEYGEHIDDKDNAICCYIAVDEGDMLKIFGRFSGKTLVIAYDAIIDGVCRKAGSFAAKTVQVQKGKKLDVDAFLYQTSKGTIDTTMRVAQLDKAVKLHEHGPEIVGTIELHVHITRQLDVEHDLGKIRKFNEANSGTDEYLRGVGSAKIDPEFVMEFDQNCSPLEKRKANQEQRKIDGKRPGTGSWVVFRYYYRSKQSIDEQKMEMTYDPKIKGKSIPPPRLLEMEAVPDLPLGAKPAINDDDNSTRASSVPPDGPSTPSKTPAKRPATPKSATPSVKEQPKSAIKMASTGSTKKPASDSQPKSKEGIQQSKQPGQALGGRAGIKSSGPLHKPHSLSSSPLSKSISQARMFIPKTHTATDPFASLDDDTEEIVETSEEKGFVGKELNIAHKKPFGKHTPASLTDKSTSKEMFTDNAEAASVTNFAGSEPQKNDHKVAAPPAKQRLNFPNVSVVVPKPVERPLPIDTSTLSPQKKIELPTTPTTPTKRPADTATTAASPDLKRVKTLPTPSTPVSVPRITSASLSPHPMSVELQVAEQRKRLEAMRKKRQEMAQKQTALDEQMAPYKQRMLEELARIQQEMADEENALAEEEERFNASVEMLEEFKNGGA